MYIWKPKVRGVESRRHGHKSLQLLIHSRGFSIVMFGGVEDLRVGCGEGIGHGGDADVIRDRFDFMYP